MKKFVQHFSQLEESIAGKDLATPTDIDLQPITESVDKELVLCVCVCVCVCVRERGGRSYFTPHLFLPCRLQQGRSGASSKPDGKRKWRKEICHSESKTNHWPS